MRRDVTRSLATTLLLAAATGVSGRPLNFAVFDTGTLGDGDTCGRAINNHGYVVGFAAPIVAFGWERGEIWNLGSGEYAKVWGVNDLGQAAGELGALFDSHAVIWHPDSTIEVLIEDEGSEAFDINNLGQVVGQTERPSGPALPFLWDSGTVTILEGLDNGFGEAEGINDSTVIVGSSRIDNRQRAFIWTNGVMSQLVGLSETEASTAHAINNLDLVVGEADSSFWRRAVVWRDGLIERIDTHPDAVFDSVALGVNNLNEVVGFFEYALDRAFLYRDGEMLSLDEFLPPQSGWNIAVAHGINDSGLIAGAGYRDGVSDLRGVVTVPVDPVLSLANPVPGLDDQINVIPVTGVTPGNRVYFLYGTTGGGTVIPTCDLAAAVVQIDNARLAGSAVADANGIAILSVFVPPVASDLGNILIQAVDPADCVVSQLVVEWFE